MPVDILEVRLVVEPNPGCGCDTPATDSALAAQMPHLGTVAVLVVRITVAGTCSRMVLAATKFAVAMKQDDYLKNFATNNPNAWCKKSCDLDFTDAHGQFRSTTTTFRFTYEGNCKDLVPQVNYNNNTLPLKAGGCRVVAHRGHNAPAL